MSEKNDFVLDKDHRDELAELLRETKRNNRHDIWLWLFLYLYEKVGLDPATCNGTTMRSAIAGFLKRNSRMLEEINRQKDRFLVPGDLFKWIHENERQYRWLLSRIKDITNFRLPEGLVHLTGRNHLIAIVDLWQVDIAKKADEIEHLRGLWARHKATDNNFAWFDDKKEGSQRCICAWEWLQKNRSLGEPINNYQELLMFFDRAEYGPAEQKAIINEIKQRWNRKQFDKRTADKKQVNILLSKTVITLLDDLVKKHDLKRSEVLERLITIESDLGLMEKKSTPRLPKERTEEALHCAQDSLPNTQEDLPSGKRHFDSELQRLSDPEILLGIGLKLPTKDSAQIDTNSANTGLEKAFDENVSPHLEEDLPHPAPQSAEEDLLDYRPRASAAVTLKGRVKPREKKWNPYTSKD